jgi:Rrf2 family protein
MKISTRSQYGLRAMVYLARFFDKNKISSLKEISKAEKISFDYLEKIVSKLEKANLVESKKGVHGGYFLARSPKKIKIGEIINILEGKTFLVKCISQSCPREKKCLTKSFWQKIQNSLNSALNSLTLADLIK